MWCRTTKNTHDMIFQLFQAEEFASDDDPSSRALPETEALWYLSEASKEHRALLKHPVIASFLWLKWQRIRTFWFSNLILYVAFVAFLTTFVFMRFGGSKLQINTSSGDAGDSVYQFNNASKTAVKGLSVVLVALCAVLFFREVFQMLASFKRYFFSPENIMELTIISLTLAIVCAPDADGAFEVKRHLAAVCVVLSWMEVLLLIGRHPRSVLSTFRVKSPFHL